MGLGDKVRSGKASQKERTEYDKMLEPVRTMKSGVLVDCTEGLGESEGGFFHKEATVREELPRQARER